MGGLSKPFKNVGLAQEATVATAASSPLGSTPRGANAVLLQTKTADIRWTTDGSTPTASHGFLMVHDADPYLLNLNYGDVFKAIRSASTDAPLSFQFVKLLDRFF